MYFFLVLRQHAPEGHDVTCDLEAASNIIDAGEDLDKAMAGSIESALHIVSKAGDVAKIKALLERGADINILSHKSTPLYTACYYSQEEAAKLLIEEGCDITQHDATHRTIDVGHRKRLDVSHPDAT